MKRISPKIEIINHFDNLINKLNIDIENCLKKYKDEQILSEILLAIEILQPFLTKLLTIIQ